MANQHALLQIHSGVRSGQSYPLIRRVIRIGRQSGNDIRPTEYEKVSRRHAVVTWNGSAFTIQDVGSTGGTYVNGRRLDSERPVILSAGDDLQMGDLKLRLFLPTPEPRFEQSGFKGQSSRKDAFPVASVAACVAVLVALIGFGIRSTQLSGSQKAVQSKGNPGTPPPNKENEPNSNAKNQTENETKSGDMDSTVLAQCKTATVLVVALSPTPDGKNQEGGSGSGFVIDDGWLVTNAHVVLKNYAEATQGAEGILHKDIVVGLNCGVNDQKLLKSTSCYVDVEHDLAMVKVDKGFTPEPLTLRSSSDLKETEGCYNLGFPGLEKVESELPVVSVQEAKMQAIRYRANELIYVQFGGSATHGNSGGPIVDKKGRVVGVVDRSARPNGEVTDPTQGVGIFYAVPTHYIQDLAVEVKKAEAKESNKEKSDSE